MPKVKKLDPRVIRTRQLLRDALIALIDERGFDSVSVQDITERATINRATFYLHYRDKQDLLISSTNEILQELIASLDKTEANATFEMLDQPPPSFIGMFEQIAGHANFYLVMLSKHPMPHFLSQLQRVLTEFIQNGLSNVLANDHQLTVPKEIVIRYTASAFLGVIIWWLENDMSYSPKYMASNLLLLATKGPYVDNPF